MSEYTISEVEEEIQAQREELTAALDQLHERNQQLEKQLEETEQRKNELNTLLYRFYHDLKSPITSLKGLLSIQEIITKEELVTKSKPNIDHLENNLQSLIDFAESINRKELRKERKINIKSLIEDTVNSLKELHEIRSEVNININEDLPKLIPFRVSYFKSIARYILDNSLVFRKLDTSLELNITIKVDDSNNFLSIDFTDNGEGMDQEVLEKCLDMFYRGTSSSTGSGLGLYIVKNMVFTLRGDLKVISNRNNGTTISILIPISTE